MKIIIDEIELETTYFQEYVSKLSKIIVQLNKAWSLKLIPDNFLMSEYECDFLYIIAVKHIDENSELLRYLYNLYSMKPFLVEACSRLYYRYDKLKTSDPSYNFLAFGCLTLIAAILYQISLQPNIIIPIEECSKLYCKSYSAIKTIVATFDEYILDSKLEVDDLEERILKHIFMLRKNVIAKKG